MTQNSINNIRFAKRWVDKFSAGRLVFFRLIFVFLGILLLSLSACKEPEIKLMRADRRIVDTLVNNQLDSILPTLDSLCKVQKISIIQKAVDSIMAERKKREERLRLSNPKEL